MYCTQSSAGKIVAGIFWDSTRVLLIDYMLYKTTITCQYFSDFLAWLHEVICENHWGLLMRGVMHDSVPAHKARVEQGNIHQCWLEQLNHPHYSPGSVSRVTIICSDT